MPSWLLGVLMADELPQERHKNKERGVMTALQVLERMAGSTGLEPATSGLTVQCANQAAPRARSAGD
jgi:hypothetical protein